MPDSLTTKGACCNHSLNWHNAPRIGSACSAGGCRCKKYVSPSADPTLSAEVVREQLAAHGIGVTAGSKVPQCPYWYESLGLSQNVRCDAMAGHHDDHQADIGDGLTFRWSHSVAKWRDPKVTVEDVLDKLRRHGEVKPNPPLTVGDLELVPSATQVGGDHYVKRAIGPWDIWAEYGMNAFEGAILKYLLRWRDKGGVEDLKKARHTLDKLIEVEESRRDPEAG